MAKMDIFTDKITKDTVKIEKKATAVHEDYAYLNDDLPLEGWIWEFIRRNPGYIALYNEIKNDFMTVDILQGDTEIQAIHDNILSSPIKEKLYRLSKEFGILCSLDRKHHDADNFINIDKFDFLIGIPNPNKAYNQFCRVTPQIEGTKCVRCLNLSIDDKNSFVIDNQYVNVSSFFEDECRKAIMEILPPVDPSDTLYFGVSLSAKKDDIIRQIKNLLTPRLKTTKSRARDDKWKYYLIAYDLFKEGYKYPEISSIMTKAYENDIPEEIQDDEAIKQDKALKKKAKAFLKLFDMKNMENYHKNALLLINGEYKEHLFLKK